MKTAAVIAAYNEEKHIQAVVKETKNYVDTVIVVDDGSKDDTATLAKQAGAKVLRHAINLQKGAAVRTGCDYAIEQGHEQLILLDGDGQHDPQEIPRLKKHLANNDIIFGMRKKDRNMPALYKIGNWGLTTISTLLFGIAVRDSQCGYRAMSAKAYKHVRWDSSDYGMESEMIVRAGLAGLQHKEIIVKTIYHDRHKGTSIFDGVKIALNLLKWRVTL